MLFFNKRKSNNKSKGLYIYLIKYKELFMLINIKIK